MPSSRASISTQPSRRSFSNLRSAMPDALLQRLRRFHDDYFPGVQDQFQSLVQDGQHPNILFIECSDSRLVHIC